MDRCLGVFMKNKYYWQGFHYRARLIRVIDGDTIVVEARLTPKLKLDMTLRFGRINAPEARGAEKVAGLASKEALVDSLEYDEEIYIWTEKLDTFGSRYVAELYIEHENDLININDWLAYL